MFTPPTLPFDRGFGYRAAGTLLLSSAEGMCVVLCCWDHLFTAVLRTCLFSALKVGEPLLIPC